MHLLRLEARPPEILAPRERLLDLIAHPITFDDERAQLALQARIPVVGISPEN